MEFLQLINENWNLLWILATLFTGFVLWHMSQRFVSKKDFEQAITELNKQRERQEEVLTTIGGNIVELNASIKNMPNVAALHRLELGLEEVRGFQRESAAQLKGQLAAMERLNNNFDKMAMNRRGSDGA